jgi:hypothetical protein
VKNPFGDDAPMPGAHNPFTDPDAEPADDPASSIEHASARIRRLRGQVGADGLTPSATRELIDQLTTALDAAAKGIRRTD